MKPMNTFATNSNKNQSMTAQLQSAPIQQMIQNSFCGDMSKTMRLTSTLIEAVNSSEQLRACKAASIVSSALRGEGMGLMYGMGYYLVPYGDTASFILSYKGYIQLAMDTQQYEDVDVLDIRKGEYLRRNPRTGKPEFNFDFYEDDDAREAAPIIGYYGYFQLKSGVFRCEWWPLAKLLKHADRYSKAFKKKDFDAAVEKAKAGNTKELERLANGSPWYDIEGGGQEKMCRKTVIRSILNSGYAPLSSGLRDAIASDTSADGSDKVSVDMGVAADAETGEVIEGNGVVVNDVPGFFPNEAPATPVAPAAPVAPTAPVAPAAPAAPAAEKKPTTAKRERTVTQQTVEAPVNFFGDEVK